ncbi:MAG: tryptophan 2,3-dioxygenase family protein [Gemmatimonadetes bacterium]|nr:tryptophan 2,3-dioxygenase family protein [Gemmatimonadota bacterium]
MALTYPSYLRLRELLSLQQPVSDPEEHDEILFIVIHQVYELWFKLLKHEVEKANACFSDGDLYGALATFKRLRTVMKTLVSQLDILETMTPMSFSSFRDRLETASGFQSTQFRELEFMLGQKRSEMLAYYKHDSAGHAELEKRLSEPSVQDHFNRFLEGHGVEVPETIKNKDMTASHEPSKELQEQLLRLYREKPDLVLLFEVMIDFDEGLQEWRYRHLKMVERTIGDKRGTGGSPGAAFLRQSLFKPIFPDLWEIRRDL